jgi:quinohemoprotein ethanol dehydrogenase
MSLRSLRWLTLIALAALAFPASAQTTTLGPGATAPDAPQSYGAIDFDRLMSADSEPENWLTEGRDQGKSHHSPLAEINRETVGALGYAWGYDTLTLRGLEATPIVVDGVMYTSGTTGRVYALNAATGAEIWFFDPENDGQVNRYTCCDEVNRGVAVYDGMVYVASLDGRLFGLDAATGAVAWVQDTFIYPDRAYTSSGAPEVAGDVVVIGNAGGDYDARGYVSAYDRRTGEFRWRFFVVPRDPALGPQEHPELDEIALPTWDPESRWEIGLGGTPWNGMAYDPEINLLYVGTGNAALFNWRERSPAGGDNLFLCSILAIDPDTGRLVWHHQQTPRESWDYTAVQPMILADLEVNGEVRKVLMQAPKNGFFWIYDRATGEVLSADPFVEVNWADGVDLETGRPRINEAQADYTTGEPKFVLPSAMGGHNWHPMAYSPDTGLVYIPAIEAGFIIGDLTEGHVYRPKQPNAGHVVLFGDSMLVDPSTLPGPLGATLAEVQAAGVQGQGATLKAFDPQTGEEVWRQDSVGWYDRAGVLATGGGLVFQGTDEGFLRAFDDLTGEKLWEVEVGTSIMAAPMTYAVDGTQYVAVMAGWGGGGWFAPHETSAAVKYGNFGRIVAFRLGGGPTPVPPPLATVAAPIPEPPTQWASDETVEQGRGLFARSCTLCHANRPDGLTPDLRRMSAFTHEQFDDIVLRGARRTRSMPQFDDVLDEAQSDAIHAYLVSLAWQAYEAQEAGANPDAGGPAPSGPGDAAGGGGTGHEP